MSLIEPGAKGERSLPIDLLFWNSLEYELIMNIAKSRAWRCTSVVPELGRWERRAKSSKPAWVSYVKHVHTHTSTHTDAPTSGGRGRKFVVSSKPVCSTYGVPGQYKQNHLSRLKKGTIFQRSLLRQFPLLCPTLCCLSSLFPLCWTSKPDFGLK